MDTVTVTVEWTQPVGAVYNVKILPSVTMLSTGSTNQLTIPYNIEYNLTVETTAPCGTNTTALIRLKYG